MSIHHVERAALTSLPPAKKLVFMAICDAADKETRIAAPGMEALHLWSGLTSKSRVSQIVAELIDEGYLTRLVAGRKGRRAEFEVFSRIACCPLHSGSGPADPVKGPAQRTLTVIGSDKGSDLDRTPSVSPSNSVPDGTDAHHVNGQTCDTRTEEVNAVSAQTLVGEWLDNCPQRPPSRVIGHVARELKQLLADGIDYDAIRWGLATWARRSLHPSTLASVVHEQQQRPAAASYTHGDGPARVMTGTEWAQEGRHA